MSAVWMLAPARGSRERWNSGQVVRRCIAFEGIAAAKAGFDMLRAAIGVVRDAGDLLPPEKQPAVSAALDAGERQLGVAEAQLAQAFGYEICKCEFPPTPMLAVGYQRTGAVVYECPKCKLTTANGFNFTRTKPKP